MSNLFINFDDEEFYTIKPRGYKTFFKLCSVEHKMLNAHKYKKYPKIQHFSGSYKPRMLFYLLINVKMPTIVGILIFMSRKNSMLNRVEHEKTFITSEQRHMAIIYNTPSTILSSVFY